MAQALFDLSLKETKKTRPCFCIFSFEYTLKDTSMTKIVAIHFEHPK